ncbi:hypothetical protein ACQ4XT_02150 [Halobacillus faecis]
MIIQPILVIRAVSIAAGVLILWILQEKEKKESIESFLSLLTTWIFVFIGAKFVTRWDLVFDYPLSVLSYPGGAMELYIATFLTIVFEWRKRMVHRRFAGSSILVLATSLLAFALLRQLVLAQGNLVDVAFAFVFFLLVLFLIKPAVKIAAASTIGVVCGWLYQAPELMGYRINVWFYVILSLMVWGYILSRRKRA